MRPPIKYVLDVTIAYPHKMPLSLVTLSFGTREPCDIGVHYKIYDATDVCVCLYLLVGNTGRLVQKDIPKKGNLIFLSIGRY